MIFLLGPCQLESQEHAFMMASEINKICTDLKVDYYYKTSFDKANRTSIHGQRGLGIEAAIEVFQNLKEMGIKIVTDVHECWQVEKLIHSVNMFQVPALLSRQTDLILEVAKTGKPLNLKKGQFMGPNDMIHAVEKVNHFQKENDIKASSVYVTERGTTFGYNNLVVDFRTLYRLRRLGIKTIFDATHSTQYPGASIPSGMYSGGQREMAHPLARAAVVIGVSGIFMEVHNDPDNAPSDGPCMIYLDKLKEIMYDLIKLDEYSRG